MRISKIKVDFIDSCGSDLSVVNAARVSFHKESELAYTRGVDGDGNQIAYLKEGDVKLINYLASHGHTSPFNHAFLSYRVKAPIFVARQLVKHKFMPWNEVSRRYVDEEPEFYMPDGWRERAENVKQGSGDTCISDITVKDIGVVDIDKFVLASMRHNLFCYNSLLEANISAEQARMILPQNMMTEWIWSGTLGAFANMLKLRLDPHTQKESRDVANMIFEDAVKRFPVSLAALLKT